MNTPPPRIAEPSFPEPTMQPNAAQPTLAAVSAQPEAPPRVVSDQLLRGHRTVEIEHGEQRYTLRVTKDNKLILTK